MICVTDQSKLTKCVGKKNDLIKKNRELNQLLSRQNLIFQSNSLLRTKKNFDFYSRILKHKTVSRLYYVCCLVQCAISYECAPLTVCLICEFIQLQYFCYAFCVLVCVDGVCMRRLCVYGCLIQMENVWWSISGHVHVNVCVCVFLSSLFEIQSKQVSNKASSGCDFQPYCLHNICIYSVWNRSCRFRWYSFVFHHIGVFHYFNNFMNILIFETW